MREIIFLMLLCALVSCGSKKKEPESFNFDLTQQEDKKVEFVESRLDSDFDGLSDSFEDQNKMNKKIADLPRVELEVDKDIVLKTNFFTNSGNGRAQNKILFEKENQTFINQVRRKVALYAYKDLVGRDQSNFELRDIYTLDQKCISQKETRTSLQDFKNLSSVNVIENMQFDIKYRLKFKLIKDLKRISNINAKLTLEEEKLANLEVQRKHYNFENENIEFKEERFKRLYQRDQLGDILNTPGSKCVRSSILDFDYVVGNKTLNFKERFEAVEQNNAHLLILHKGKLVIKSVSPKHYNLESFFKEMGYKYKIGYDGNILSLNNFENELPSFTNIDFSDTRIVDKKKWFFFSSTKSSVPSELKAGHTYIIAHLAVRDILSVADERTLTKLSSVKKKFVLKQVYPGDRFVFDTTVDGKLVLPNEVSRLEGGYLDLGLAGVSTKKACHYTEKNINISSFGANFKSMTKSALEYYAIYVGKNKRKVEPKVIKQRLLYEIFVVASDLRDGELEIYLPQKDNKKGSYTRLKSWKAMSGILRCAKNRASWTQQHKAEAPIDLVFDFSIERFGIIR